MRRWGENDDTLSFYHVPPPSPNGRLHGKCQNAPNTFLLTALKYLLSSFPGANFGSFSYQN